MWDALMRAWAQAVDDALKRQPQHATAVLMQHGQEPLGPVEGAVIFLDQHVHGAPPFRLGVSPIGQHKTFVIALFADAVMEVEEESRHASMPWQKPHAHGIDKTPWDQRRHYPRSGGPTQ